MTGAVLVNQHPRSIVQNAETLSPRARIDQKIWQSARSAAVGNGETFEKVGNLLTAADTQVRKAPFNANQPFDLSPSSTGRRGTDFRFA